MLSITVFVTRAFSVIPRSRAFMCGSCHGNSHARAHHRAAPARIISWIPMDSHNGSKTMDPWDLEFMRLSMVGAKPWNHGMRISQDFPGWEDTHGFIRCRCYEISCTGSRTMISRVGATREMPGQGLTVVRPWNHGEGMREDACDRVPTTIPQDGVTHGIPWRVSTKLHQDGNCP